MKITVKFFAAHRKAAGRSQVDLEMPPSSTVQDLLDALVERYPHLEDRLPFTTVSVNHRQAHPDRDLREEDQVSLFPPIGGG